MSDIIDIIKQLCLFCPWVNFKDIDTIENVDHDGSAV